MKKYRRIIQLRKLTEIWNNSLVIIGLLGVMVLFLAYFVQRNETLLMFGQMLFITAHAALCFFCYMLILRGCGRTTSVLLIMLGSAGLVFGAASQIMLDQVYLKPPVINVAGTMLAIGAITLLNKFYKYVENTGS